MMRRPLATLAVAALAGGCGLTQKPSVKPPYYGPTDDLPTLVGRLNARATRLDSLRAEGSFDAEFVDRQTDSRDGGGGDVTLLYRPPRDVRLVGKAFTERVFDIGSNAEQFWLSLPRQKRLFVGTHGAEPGERARALPVRPEVIAELLSVTPVATNLLLQPVPVLRFDHDADCYAVTFQVRLVDRWAVQKEVWYDRMTLHPRRVLMYGPTGRVVLRAELSDVKAVDGYPADAVTPPLELPSRYDLAFTDTGSTFTLRLRRLERERNGTPNDANFGLPATPPGTTKESLDR